jgi:microcystin-dependent protein
MGTPYIAEIRIFSFNFAPKGWALCNGQLLPINQNQALFSILGTTYGGDGRVSFGLPDLRGRVPMHTGSTLSLGERAGVEGVTLNISQLPAHTHVAVGSTTVADQVSPQNNIWAASSYTAYASSPNIPMSPQAIGQMGGSQPHNNMSPYLTLNFCIALVGVFPSRS